MKCYNCENEAKKKVLGVPVCQSCLNIVLGRGAEIKAIFIENDRIKNDKETDVGGSDGNGLPSDQGLA